MPAKKKLNKEDLERITRAAGLVNVEDIAAIWGMSKTTLYKYASAELEKGRASTRLFVAGKLLDAIKQGNFAAIIFYLKTQAGWREVSRIETVSEVTHKGVIREEPLDEDEWQKQYGVGGVGAAAGSPTRSH
jgi:hypothetical protein